MKELRIAKVVNTHGIKGEVRIFPETDFPEERFQVGHGVIFDNQQNIRQYLTIASVRAHKNFLLLSFEGLNSITDVEKFQEGYLMITADQQHELPAGEYYYHQIIGLDVETTSGEALGVIKEIMPLGAQDVWVIQPLKAGRQDIMIPYHEEFVKDIDLDKQMVLVEVIEGLIQDED